MVDRKTPDMRAGLFGVELFTTELLCFSDRRKRTRDIHVRFVSFRNYYKMYFTHFLIAAFLALRSISAASGDDLATMSDAINKSTIAGNTSPPYFSDTSTTFVFFFLSHSRISSTDLPTVQCRIGAASVTKPRPVLSRSTTIPQQK
jgi:hypothetical protein